jgi:hypothetical protein
MPAAPHIVHPDLQKLVEKGKFLVKSKAFIPAFQGLDTTSTRALFHDLAKFPADLLATKDFMRTLKVPDDAPYGPLVTDSFQRPVQWVISVPAKEKWDEVTHLIIISPHEANQLLPLIRQHDKVTLHLFAPRTNETYASLDGLDLWNVGRKFSPGSIGLSLNTLLARLRTVHGNVQDAGTAIWPIGRRPASWSG